MTHMTLSCWRPLNAPASTVVSSCISSNTLQHKEHRSQLTAGTVCVEASVVLWTVLRCCGVCYSALVWCAVVCGVLWRVLLFVCVLRCCGPCFVVCIVVRVRSASRSATQYLHLIKGFSVAGEGVVSDRLEVNLKHCSVRERRRTD